MQHAHHSPITRAFSLVEILVVVMIVGVMAAVVIPSFGSAGVLRTQGAVRSVVADITFAQSDALAYQRGRGIVFDATNNKYTITEYDGSAINVSTDAIFDAKGPGNRFERSLDDPRFGGAHMENIGFNAGLGKHLIFDEMGVPIGGVMGSMSTGGTIDIVGGDGKRFRITVGAFNGRVTVQEL